MLKWLGFFLVLFALMLQPWLLGVGIMVGILAGIALKLQEHSRSPPVTASQTPTTKTADGCFPILNEDWEGEVVRSIDDGEIPEPIRRHGARFRNPARYAIDLGNGEYLLYGGDGELLDLCHLR